MYEYQMIIYQCLLVPILWGRSVSSILVKLIVDVVSAVLSYFLAELCWICHCVAYSFSPSGQALLQVCLGPYFYQCCLSGSGIRNRFFTDPGSRTQIFDSLMTNFWIKVKFFLLFWCCCCIRDPRPEIRDTGSQTRDTVQDP
jgi:hypothetical protein